jgi:hypothetical protein
VTEAELEALALMLSKVTIALNTEDEEDEAALLIEFEMITRSLDGERILLFRFASPPEEEDDAPPPRHLRSVN